MGTCPKLAGHDEDEFALFSLGTSYISNKFVCGNWKIYIINRNSVVDLLNIDMPFFFFKLLVNYNISPLEKIKFSHSETLARTLKKIEYLTMKSVEIL